MAKLATAETKNVRCRVIKTPRPAYPWKIEVLTPHTADQNTRLHFPTKEAALEEIRTRKWKLAKSAKRFETLRMALEFIAVTVLLFPLVYKLAKTSPIEHLTNPYTGWVLTVMVASFMYPVIKLAILIIRGADSTTELVVRVGSYLFFANCFFFTFGSAFAPTTPNASAILAEIDKHRSEMVANGVIFPGMTVEEYYVNPPKVPGMGEAGIVHHTRSVRWEESQRKYRQLKVRAEAEGYKPNDGVHPYKKVLQFAYNLWVEKHPEDAPRARR